jgi:hypothetical protein
MVGMVKNTRTMIYAPTFDIVCTKKYTAYACGSNGACTQWAGLKGNIQIALIKIRHLQVLACSINR